MVVFLMELPFILAGPILRRVDTHNINVWIATSRPFQMGAELYMLDEELTPVSIHCKTRSIQLGKSLYIYLVSMLPESEKFPTDSLLGYNLLFNQGSEMLDLSSFGLLNPNNTHSIVYGDLPFPSFFIHHQLESHILYGSCRKLHGKRDDALAAGDMELQSTYRDLTKRPNSLFLLGDQIYADNVADPLFPVITSIANRIMGRDEELTKLDKRLDETPFHKSLHQINGRQFIMEQFCHFTSNHSQNHLMKFGEYAAMYLLSWGPELWETIQEQGGLPTFEDEDENKRIYYAFPQSTQFEKEHQTEHSLLQKRFEEQSDDLRQTLSSLHRIRRLLANIPTYMIFDDHDVTDDWNLSSDWKENVSSSPLGKHVVANGLGAYWAFQGWGNAPDSFDQQFINKMNMHFTKLTFESTTYQSWVDCLWNYTNWYFVAPTEPKTVFLDTRTQRTFDNSPQPVKLGMLIQENLRSPQLISHKGWQLVSQSLLNTGWRSGEPLIIASPAPLYGVGLIESFLHSYVYPLRAIGFPVHQAIDFEAWKYNGKGFSEFLEWIFKWNPSICVIVSGDVHYASSVKTSIQSTDGKVAEIIQFTSSPMNNMSFSGLWGMLLKSTIWLNSIKRKKQSIVRYCDNAYNIRSESSNTPCPSDYIWRENLRYLSTDKGTIIKTDNNLGLFSISPEIIQNKLLQMKNLEKEDLSFEPIQMPNEP